MTRVKRGTTANKRRKNILKHTKGFRWGRKAKYKLAKDAVRHAWTFAYRDRKVKKREARQLWQIKIGVACKKYGSSYSKFIKQMKDAKIELDRKVLAELIEKNPEIFEKIIKGLGKK